MNSINPSLNLDQASKSEAQDDPADEPPIRNHTKLQHHWSLSFKTLAIIFIFLTQFPYVFSTSVGHQTDRNADMRLVERGNILSNRATQHLNKRSTSPSPISIVLIPILVLASGLFAGLTIGYMSLDSTQLAVLAKSGTPVQKKLAQKVAPLRKNGHMLLITLLIANMIANETLPIVSEKAFGGGFQAVIISTVLVIIFSEVIPQSVCSTHALRIGAAFAKPIQFIIYLFYPIVWPISYLLNKIVGEHHGMIYRPAELKELVNLHARNSNQGGDLAADVVTIIGSAIDLQERVVGESMTRLNNCFMLNIDTQLNYETMSDILASGHSRIPVYEDVIIASGTSRRIVGALLTKQLILIDPEDGVLLRDFPLNPLPHVASDMPLLNILNSFQEGRSHLAVVCPSVSTLANAEVCKPVLDQPTDKHVDSKFPWWRAMLTKKVDPSQKNSTGSPDALTVPLAIQPSKELLTDKPLGIISLEDVLEALLNEPIYDETDLDEHGHIAVPPYVPPEAYAALRKPTAYSMPSPLYDSKVLHKSLREALQIETEVISTSASTHSPDTSRNLSSRRSFRADEPATPALENFGSSCDVEFMGGYLSSMLCSGDTNDLAPLDTCEPPKVALNSVGETEFSEALFSHERENLHQDMRGSKDTCPTTDPNPVTTSSTDNDHLETTNATPPESKAQDTVVEKKEPPGILSENHSSLPEPSNLVETFPKDKT